jgi:outer membrane protein
MTRTFLLLLFPITILLPFTQAEAQTESIKIGCADTEYILSQLPEMRQVESELKSLETQLRNQVNGKTEQLKARYAKYMEEGEKMQPALRANEEREMQLLNENLEKLKQDAQAALEKKHNQLMEPLYAKTGQAIDEVAKENGYTLILIRRLEDYRIILYADEHHDITSLVLKRLGVASPPPSR